MNKEHTITVNIYGKFTVEFSQYTSTGNTAVILHPVDYPWEYIKLSLNPEIKLPEDEFVVKNYSENSGIANELVKTRFFEVTDKIFTLPHNLVCPIWRIRN